MLHVKVRKNIFCALFGDSGITFLDAAHRNSRRLLHESMLGQSGIDVGHALCNFFVLFAICFNDIVRNFSKPRQTEEPVPMSVKVRFSTNVLAPISTLMFPFIQIGGNLLDCSANYNFPHVVLNV